MGRDLEREGYIRRESSRFACLGWCSLTAARRLDFCERAMGAASEHDAKA